MKSCHGNPCTTCLLMRTQARVWCHYSGCQGLVSLFGLPRSGVIIWVARVWCHYSGRQGLVSLFESPGSGVIIRVARVWCHYSGCHGLVSLFGLPGSGVIIRVARATRRLPYTCVSNMVFYAQPLYMVYQLLHQTHNK